MRIIGGDLKGRRLAPLKGRIRPTAAKVREAIFDILAGAVDEARVLDLFAGTGALGIEALSRGAREAVFVEDNPEALKVLRRNLATLELGARTLVLPVPVAAALRQLAARQERFSLAFLDPPYGGGLAAGTLTALAGAHLLLARGWAVAEFSRRESLPAACQGLRQLETRRYGDTLVAFYLADTSEIQEHS